MSAPSGSSKKKRKSENIGCMVSTPSKSSKRHEIELDVDTVDNANETEEANNLNEADLAIANNSMRTFITTWKEACRENAVPEVCSFL